MKELNDQDWLVGGGEMGKLIRSMDWSKNSLGPVESWPQSLRTSVSLCLSSTFPINIVWGPDHVQIYNDAYRPICGALHPASMGSKFKELWASALPVVGGAFDRGLGGEGTYIENQQMFLDRYGYLEEAFMTFSFGPIRDESGGVGGIFHPITESTEKMLSSRRTQILRDLAILFANSKTLPEIYASVIASAKSFELDIPFVFFYEPDASGAIYEFKTGAGLNSPHPQALQSISQNDFTGDFFIQNLKSTHSGPYEENPRQAVLLPIVVPGEERPVAMVVAAVSARRALDAEYQGFYEMLRNTISTAVANVKAYEQEQKRAEALAQIDRAKTAFFSNVSHEFRTPLTLMLGPLEDSLADTDHPLDSVQRHRQEVVQRNSLRLLKLVNSLLDFSRIEAGRVEASFQPVDLSKVTVDLASLFRSTVEKAGLALKIETDSLSESIYVDLEMWEKIILNLLSNAFKFTFSGSITVRIQSTAEGARVSVSDTGIGVAESELPRLFERFHRVQGAKSRTYEGTGIGLALVQELVQMHGGVITVTSVPDRGTTFSIDLKSGAKHLPADRILASSHLESTAVSSEAYLQEARMWISESEKSEASNSSPSEATLILADDNADMREYVATILAGRNWTVLTAKDGQEAFEIAQRHQPDLILSDVMMPVLDGFGLLERLRKDPNLKSVPLILLSARAGEEAKVEGLRAGADDYMVKPFSAKELITRVSSLLKMNELRYVASEELRTNADKFRSMFSHASVNIAMLDLEGNILEINDAFLRSSGFSASEVVGKHFSSITHADDIAPNIENLKRLAAGTQRSASFDKRYLKKSGGHFWVKTNISSFLGQDEKPLYVIAVSQDIEAMKSTESNYQEAVQNLQDEKELRESFVATLTHDLRSPLTAAKASAQLIQRKPEHTNTVLNLASRIAHNVDRADRMIQDLLDANRIRAGEKLPLDREEYDLGLLIEDTLDNLATIHGARFEFKRPLEPFFGNVGTLALRRAIENLANNAVKYGDQRQVDVTLNRLKDRIEIAVHNFGNPISPEDQRHIFDPYRRTESADRGKQKGWGLGLTLVRGVAEAHGGEIAVESSESAGTTFKLLLPFDTL